MEESEGKHTGSRPSMRPAIGRCPPFFENYAELYIDTKHL